MRLSYFYSLVPVALAAAGAYASPVSVSDSVTAIAIAQKLCGTAGTVRGYAPFDKWDAHLEGDNWQVHAADQPTYFGVLPRTAELWVQVPKNGSTPSRCDVVANQ